MRKKLSLLSVIIKSKQKIQVIKLWKEPGNNWAIELGMTNPRPLEHAVIQSLKKNGLQRQNSHWKVLFNLPQVARCLSEWLSCCCLGEAWSCPACTRFTLRDLASRWSSLCGAGAGAGAGAAPESASHWPASRWSWLHRIVSPAPARLVQLHCRSRWALSAATATTPPELLLQACWSSAARDGRTLRNLILLEQEFSVT